MVGRDIHRWKHLQAFDREQMEEILVAKLIGTHNRTIAGMILQQALGLGLIGFAVGKIAATVRGRAFPRYVLLEPGDALRGFVLVMVVCTFASTLAIRAALKVDPASAIGGWHGPRRRHPHRRLEQALRRRPRKSSPLSGASTTSEMGGLLGSGEGRALE